jgi:hypothetical protein
MERFPPVQFNTFNGREKKFSFPFLIKEFMSYNFDGKIANQRPQNIPKCSKCGTELSQPDNGTFAETSGPSIYEAYSYLKTSFYIYETKSGRAVVYCSEYCRNKHNHRFQK